MTGRQRGEGRRPRRSGRSKLGAWALVALLALLALYLGALEFSRPRVSGDRLRLDTFVAAVKAGDIRTATILDVDAIVVGAYQRPDGTRATYNAPLLAASQEDVTLGILVPAGVPTSVDQQVGKRIASLALFGVPALMLVVILAYVVLSYKQGTGIFAVRSGARKITLSRSGVRFADVAGQDAAVLELEELKEFLADPGRFAGMGAEVPKGVLLFGSPGCGKTMLARALANEADVSFFSISGSDFVELYVGVGASRVRDLFKEAREHAPALIFIDELDSIGRARSTGGATIAQGKQEQALNQILAEMDGFAPSEGVIVLGATNRPDMLDTALLRPGRFDRTIGLALPDEAARLAILAVHARNKRLGGDVDLAALAHLAIGLSGADLASVANEGALLAARRRDGVVSQADLEQGLRRIMEAPERQRRLSSRARSIGRRYTYTARVTFADLAGVDDAIAELREVREYLADAKRFTRIGAVVPRCILLSGPPGCGKTLLARAVAGEANAAYFSVAGSEFVEVFVGEGASRVRDLFGEAKSMAPAILFIDDIDAIGGHRATMATGGGQEREQTLNQLLVELDGLDANSGLIVMAAANRPDMLDRALVRPGRFDRHVAVTLPDRAGRLAILRLHATSKRFADDVDLGVVAALTGGYSGADLANALNEAALLSARRGLAAIPAALVEEGVDRVREGISSKQLVMGDADRRVVAYHESGHALVALAVPGASPPHKLTILPRGVSLDRCTTLDAEERMVLTRSELLGRLASYLGGAVAEEMVWGEASSGCSSDLKYASELARRMVRELGMSPALGLVAYPEQHEDGRPGRSYSEESARRIDAEIRALVDEAAVLARSLLSRPALDRVAAALVEHETVGFDLLRELAAEAERWSANGGAPTGVASPSRLDDCG